MLRNAIMLFNSMARSKTTWSSTRSLVLGNQARGSAEEGEEEAISRKQVRRSLIELPKQSRPMLLHSSTELPRFFEPSEVYLYSSPYYLSLPSVQ